MTILRKITLFVLLVHFGLVIVLSGHHLITKQWKPPRPIKVQTFAAIPVTTHAATTPPPTPIKKKEAPTAKPTIAKAVAKNIESQKILPLPKRTLEIPKKILPKTEAISSTPDPTYAEYLIAFLQSMLDLPEFGDVVAAIEIDRFGKLVQCTILETKSKTNSEFIKNRLQELTFPCLNDKSQTFTITFRNVENY